VDFDAGIDLLDSRLPAAGDMSDAAAVNRVRSAVSALPGAKWIDVVVCRGVPDSPLWLRIYKPGSGEVMRGGEWDAISERVGAAVKTALT
jgi:hypothetical protein